MRAGVINYNTPARSGGVLALKQLQLRHGEARSHLTSHRVNLYHAPNWSKGLPWS